MIIRLVTTRRIDLTYVRVGIGKNLPVKPRDTCICDYPCKILEDGVSIRVRVSALRLTLIGAVYKITNTPIIEKKKRKKVMTQYLVML